SPSAPPAGAGGPWPGPLQPPGLFRRITGWLRPPTSVQSPWGGSSAPSLLALTLEVVGTELLVVVGEHEGAPAAIASGVVDAPSGLLGASGDSEAGAGDRKPRRHRGQSAATFTRDSEAGGWRSPIQET